MTWARVLRRGCTPLIPPPTRPLTSVLEHSFTKPSRHARDNTNVIKLRKIRHGEYPRSANANQFRVEAELHLSFESRCLVSSTKRLSPSHVLTLFNWLNDVEQGLMDSYAHSSSSKYHFKIRYLPPRKHVIPPSPTANCSSFSFRRLWDFRQRSCCSWFLAPCILVGRRQRLGETQTHISPKDGGSISPPKRWYLSTSIHGA